MRRPSPRCRPICYVCLSQVRETARAAAGTGTESQLVCFACLFIIVNAPVMGARRGGKGGTCPPPLEFEKRTSYAAVLQNTLKFSSKTSQKTQKFSFAPSARRNMVNFWYGAPKTCRLFKVSVALPPSGKISAGAHDKRFVFFFFFFVQTICSRRTR